MVVIRKLTQATPTQVVSDEFHRFVGRHEAVARIAKVLLLDIVFENRITAESD